MNTWRMPVSRKQSVGCYLFVVCGFSALLLLAGCNRISHPKDLASVSITLARMSSGPAYSVTVHGTGDVEYEGFRGVPVRGQRTHTNARTRKGPKRMQVAGKKKAAKK